MDKLTPKQEKFMLALMTSRTTVEACQVAGIARSTGQKYLKSVTFRRAWRDYRGETMRQASAKLQSASLEAIEVLRSIMLDETVSPYARQQSAQTILTMAYKTVETMEVIEKLEELETRILDDEQYN